MGEDGGARGWRTRCGLVVLTAIVLACLAACAGPPSSGPIQRATLNQDLNKIRVTLKEPSPQMTPTECIDGFLAATAGYGGDATFSVAQKYLAQPARDQWAAEIRKDGHKAKIYATSSLNFSTPEIYARDGSRLRSLPAQSAWEPGMTAKVDYSYLPIASLDPSGFYSPLDNPATITGSFQLDVRPDKQWEITNEPDGRMIDIDDLRRAYQALPVFEPVAESVSLSTATVRQIYVVPTDALATYTDLATALLEGQDEVPGPVPRITADSNRGVLNVNLPSAPKDNAQSVAMAMAQTFQAAGPALQQYAGGAAVQYKTINLLVNGTQVGGQDFTTGAITALPAVYYVAGGSVYSAVSSDPTNPPSVLTVLDGNPARRTFGKIAVRQEHLSSDDTGQPGSKSTVSVAAVVTGGAEKGSGDVVVYANLSSANNPDITPVRWYHAADPQLVTDLTWDPVDGSLWIVDDGDLYNVKPPTATGGMTPPVRMPPSGTDLYQRIRLSPDGRQAALVTAAAPGPGVSHRDVVLSADTSSSELPSTARLVRIVRDANGSPVQLGDGFELQPTVPTASPSAPTLVHVADVSWAGGRTVVLLAKEGQQAPMKLYRVYADGSQDSALVEGVEQAEGQTTQIAAEVADPASPRARIFSNGTKTDSQGQGTTAIYWKGKTFDYFRDGDNPVVATDMVSGP